MDDPPEEHEAAKPKPYKGWKTLRTKDNIVQEVLAGKDRALEQVLTQVDALRKKAVQESAETMKVIARQEKAIANHVAQMEEAKREAARFSGLLDTARQNEELAAHEGFVEAQKSQSEVHAANELLRARLARMESRYHGLTEKYKNFTVGLSQAVAELKFVVTGIKNLVDNEIKSMQIWIRTKCRMVQDKAQLLCMVDWSIPPDQRVLDCTASSLVDTVNTLLETYRREQPTHVIEVPLIDKQADGELYQACNKREKCLQAQGAFGLTPPLLPDEQQRYDCFMQSLHLFTTVGKRCQFLTSAINSARSFHSLKGKTIDMEDAEALIRRDNNELLQWLNTHVSKQIVSIRTALRYGDKLLIDAVDADQLGDLASRGQDAIDEHTDVVCKLLVKKAAFNTKRRNLLEGRKPPRTEQSFLVSAVSMCVPSSPAKGVSFRMQNSGENSFRRSQKIPARKRRRAIGTQTPGVERCHCGLKLSCVECTQSHRLEMLYPKAVLTALTEARKEILGLEAKKLHTLKEKNAVLGALIDLVCDSAKVTHEANMKFKRQVVEMVSLSPNEGAEGKTYNRPIVIKGLVDEQGVPTTAAQFMLSSPTTVPLLQAQRRREMCGAMSPELEKLPSALDLMREPGCPEAKRNWVEILEEQPQRRKRPRQHSVKIEPAEQVEPTEQLPHSPAAPMPAIVHKHAYKSGLIESQKRKLLNARKKKGADYKHNGILESLTPRPPPAPSVQPSSVVLWQGQGFPSKTAGDINHKLNVASERKQQHAPLRFPCLQKHKRVGQEGGMDGLIASQITGIQQDADKIRNFCMLAHVDHGKTTLSDVLISSNGLISSALAGKVRYLDCREDEQEKLITMKASTIALKHVHEDVPHVLNLIDSPGHVDFSCEVSTAVRLSDGAFLLVDAIDGVATQTRAVLQQAYREKVKCCLVINKIDLLVTTMNQDPVTAYQTLSNIIQDANVLMASFANADAITGEQLQEKTIGVDGLDDDKEDGWFEPSKGNVIFASSVDGWGFTTRDFAKIYSAKLGWSVNALTKALWGEWFLDMKNKKLLPTPKPGMQPMCVKFILQQIWKVYSAAEVENADERLAKLLKVTDALGLRVKENVLKKKDPRSAVAAVMNAWLPLSKSVLDAAVTQLPSPERAQAYRMTRLAPDLQLIANREARETIEQGLTVCNKKGDIMIYIAKMLDVECLPGTALQAGNVEVDADSEDSTAAFVGVSRIFSGTIRKGMTVYVMEPKHKPGGEDTIKPVIVEQLFLLMGRGLAPVDEVPAGSIFGIGGLGKTVLKSATLSNRKDACGFSQMVFQSAAVIRMSVEPKIPSDLERLKVGLALLNKADPQVEVSYAESGEHVIATAGEVHAERCIRDLVTRYAKVELNVSEPLVSFKETVVVAEHKKATVITSANKQFTIAVKAHDVPASIVKCIEDNEADLRRAMEITDPSQLSESSLKALNELKEAFEEEKWTKYWGSLWAMGPRHLGSCMLLSDAKGDDRFKGPTEQWNKSMIAMGMEANEEDDADTRLVKDSIVAGFQMAADKGPLCDEPMMGVAFVIESITEEEVETKDNVYGPLSGQLMSSMYSGCRQAFLAEGKRLVEPVYECNILASNLCHGKVYEVLKKRRAEIVDNIPQEGTDGFTVISYLPVPESFGLADELRIKTSGHATPNLVFSHWSIIDADPFFERRTEDEIEDLDETDVALISNVPRTLINKVRKRKGLHVEEQAVQKAEKMKYSTRGG